VQVGEQLPEFLFAAKIQGVQFLRPVKGYETNAFLGSHQQCLIVHFVTMPFHPALVADHKSVNVRLAHRINDFHVVAENAPFDPDPDVELSYSPLRIDTVLNLGITYLRPVADRSGKAQH